MTQYDRSTPTWMTRLRLSPDERALMRQCEIIFELNADIKKLKQAPDAIYVSPTSKTQALKPILEDKMVKKSPFIKKGK